jgi:hypothetical protein
MKCNRSNFLGDQPQAKSTDRLKRLISEVCELAREAQRLGGCQQSLVKHEREIPQLVRWYIADQLLDCTERLKKLLDGRYQAVCKNCAISAPGLD